MRAPIRRTTLLPICLVFAGCVAAAPNVDTAAENAALDDVARQFESAVNAGKVDDVMALYTADARVIPNAMATLNTPEGIRGYLNGALQSGMSNVKISKEVRELSAAGDLAVEIGTFSATVNGPQGPTPMSARYTVALKKVDGKWKLWLDMDNALPAAPAADSAAPGK